MFAARRPLPLKVLLANSYLSHSIISRKVRRSNASGLPSLSIRGDAYNEDSFDEDWDESDDEIDDDIHSSEIASMSDNRGTNFTSGGSTNYQSSKPPTAYISEKAQNFLNNQQASYLSQDRLFSLHPTESLFTGASDTYLWNGHPMLAHQTEQLQPETARSSALTTAPSLSQDKLSIESQMQQDFSERQHDMVGNRLILENVQPETVSTIVKMLFDTGADVEMRLEKAETQDN